MGKQNRADCPLCGQLPKRKYYDEERDVPAAVRKLRMVPGSRKCLTSGDKTQDARTLECPRCGARYGYSHTETITDREGWIYSTLETWTLWRLG